ncbi:hypothetical protein HPB51_022794 [Rhipicephalus microplus]|uniref:Anoctamin n=1 Tax=Rhipicephalus microplus TaxID=6941 RepID=A0A9J6ECG7_RHIMP|nr:hypothetical protein HPB51_022794 [Rhipicephalus microplus]
MVAFPTVTVAKGEKPVLPDLKYLENESTEVENEGKPNALEALWAKFWTPFPYNKQLIPDETEYFNAEFVRQREHMVHVAVDRSTLLQKFPQNEGRYFGEKTGLYFAWLGFYTSMLFLPAVVGVMTTLYGIFEMATNTPTAETCDPNIAGSFVLCPGCKKRCTYDYLYTKCTFSKASYMTTQFLRWHILQNLLRV